MFIFGVTVVLYFIKILSGSRNFWHNLRATDPSLHAAVVTYQKLYFKVKKTQLDINFLVNCPDNNVTPKFVRWKNLKSKRHHLYAVLITAKSLKKQYKTNTNHSSRSRNLYLNMKHRSATAPLGSKI
jgi:hypothetical protein